MEDFTLDIRSEDENYKKLNPNFHLNPDLIYLTLIQMNVLKFFIIHS